VITLNLEGLYSNLLFKEPNEDSSNSENSTSNAEQKDDSWGKIGDTISSFFGGNSFKFNIFTDIELEETAHFYGFFEVYKLITYEFNGFIPVTLIDVLNLKQYVKIRPKISTFPILHLNQFTRIMWKLLSFSFK